MAKITLKLIPYQNKILMLKPNGYKEKILCTDPVIIYASWD